MKYNFLRFPGGRAKAVTLSYDDGCNDDVRFLEVINRYGLKCTFNLVGKNVEAESPLSQAFIREQMLGKGHEVAVHGYNHRGQNRIRSIEGIRDILDCRLALENAFGMIIQGMAFPDTVADPLIEPLSYQKIRERVSELEIAYVRAAGKDNDRFTLPDDWYNWMPGAHHDNPEIMNYIEKFMNLDVGGAYVSRRGPKLFFMWGHSYEFSRKNNWEHLDEICEKLSGHDDIWYATNIEIYNYVQAYNSLKYSADAKIVYNPTLLDVWFDVDKTLYCVKSGETLHLKP